MRENAVVVVFVVFFHVEVDASVAFVGVSIVKNLLNQLLLLNDMSACVGLDAWRKNIQGGHSVVEAIGVILCHLHRFQLFQSGLLRDLVFALVGIVFQMTHVSDVADVAYFISDML